MREPINQKVKYEKEEFDRREVTRARAEAWRLSKVYTETCVCPHCNGTGHITQTILPREVVSIIERISGITEAMMTSRNGHRRIVYPRMIVANTLRNEYKWSLPKIAHAMSKHHTTIIHYLLKHEDNMRFDIAYKTQADTFIHELAKVTHEHEA